MDKELDRLIGYNQGPRKWLPEFTLDVISRYRNKSLDNAGLSRIANEITYAEIDYNDDLMLLEIEDVFYGLQDLDYIIQDYGSLEPLFCKMEGIANDILDGYRYEQIGILKVYYILVNHKGATIKSVACVVRSIANNFKVDCGDSKIKFAVEESVASSSTLTQAKEMLPKKVLKYKLQRADIESIYPQDIDN